MRPRTLGLLLVAMLGAACAPTGPRVAVDAGVEAAVARGRSRVLVRLRLADGLGTDPTQRQAIAAAQATVLSRLAGTDFTLVRRFETVPFLALEVGPSALAALGTMGDVVLGVVPDALSPPAGGSHPGR
jgi:hypothetical protein